MKNIRIRPLPGFKGNAWRWRPHPTLRSNQECRPPRMRGINTGMTLVIVAAILTMLVVVVVHHWRYP